MANAVKNSEVAQPQQYQASQSTWDKIADSREFQDLMATKKTFIVPAFIFFVVYYFALPVLVGYAPQFMSTKMWVCESRLPVRAVAILCGVDHRSAVRESCQQL